MVKTVLDPSDSMHVSGQFQGDTEEMLRILKERDPDQMPALFGALNPYLLRVSFANGIAVEKAEDLISETWERFFAQIQRFEGRSSLKTYLCGILLNIIREYRRNHAKVSYEEDIGDFMNHVFTPEGWWKTNPADPSRLGENKQFSDFVRECLDGLDENQRTAFFLREIEEEEPHAICHILEVTVTHLRVLICRAKDKLRKCVEGKSHEV